MDLGIASVPMIASTIMAAYGDVAAGQQQKAALDYSAQYQGVNANAAMASSERGA